ncbi:MAG: outer membrane lipid asymmetry maintenance protein MlaD [Chloroflexota bacterium]|jgi:phospholipid/cholesterol/gamma-HCH transport system substrate-binding protein
MRKFDLELAVGFFLLIGLLCLAYISVKLGRLEMMGGGYYSLFADFDRAGGVKEGSMVEIAGVPIGRVKRISLDNYQAKVEIVISRSVAVQEDAIASIRTKGLIGEKFVQITPGGSDKILPDGGRIRETESAIDVEELISKYAFGKI